MRIKFSDLGNIIFLYFLNSKIFKLYHAKFHYKFEFSYIIYFDKSKFRNNIIYTNILIFHMRFTYY